MSTPQDPQPTGSAPQPPDDDTPTPPSGESTPERPAAAGERPGTEGTPRPAGSDQVQPPSQSTMPEPEEGDAAAAGGQEAKPGAAGARPGETPGGEVPTQAWSAQPQESEPGQAWRAQPGGEPPRPEPGGQEPQDAGWHADPETQRFRAQPRQGERPEQPRTGEQPWGSGQPGSLPPGAQGYPAGGAYNYPPTPGASGEHGTWQGGETYGQGGQAGYGEQPYGPGGGSYGQQYGQRKEPDQGPYPGYPQQSFQPYEDSRQRAAGPQTYSIVGFVCAAICLFFCPIVFGAAGIILGMIGHNKGEPLGKWAAAASIVALVIGLVLSFVVYNTDIVPNT
ncbi:hypothetical protein [Nocardia donostiensis]|uniref:DUF4190 domain-containing protein n=1 Tax=Nocardia donostiensis TaxID=1538463 RepID=A0A1W0BDJ0_9NOCA|nr:hypothetical protein [Nocardia donostiensis]ONM48291.1 hypothetical protein B0T46_12980 [Nocardia donostiensis]OQS14513.1 hypothetical protein B0T36_13355 [Nocardia donostiensis]OQS20599.1 hypothetical protein B0T44_10000 [Nocardia donostiensis]